MATDVIISADTTGSMAPCIASVRRKVTEIVNDLFAKVDDLRIGVITHGDYCDAPQVVTSIAPVTNDGKDHLIRFIERAPNTKGGDADECYEYVLELVRDKVDWRAEATKVCILIGDAQPHEPGYSYGYGRDRVVVTHNWRNLSKDLADRGVKVYPVQCLGHLDPKRFYATLAQDSGTPKLELHQLADIVPLLTTIVYAQQSNDLIVDYGNDLQSQGKLNRNLAELINQVLAGKAVVISEHKLREGKLQFVDPTRFQMLYVDTNTDIKSFVLSTGAVFSKGRGFYELTKAEDIQDHKEVILRDKAGDFYTGKQARTLLNLPDLGTKRVHRSDVPIGYTAFVQSTSVNRKLIGGTRFLYDSKI